MGKEAYALQWGLTGGDSRELLLPAQVNADPGLQPGFSGRCVQEAIQGACENVNPQLLPHKV